jgi:hypothetical protein
MALKRSLELAHHIASYLQVGIRADRAAAIATIGLPIQQGLDLEVKLCHAPLGPEAAAGMQRFVRGARPEPPRPVTANKT